MKLAFVLSIRMRGCFVLHTRNFLKKKNLRTQLLLHMGEKFPAASRFWWYAIAVVFANVRKLPAESFVLLELREKEAERHVSQ